MWLTTDNVPVSNVSSDIFMPKQSTKGIRRIVEESDEEKNRQIIEVCKLNELNGAPALPQYLLSIFECFLTRRTLQSDEFRLHLVNMERALNLNNFQPKQAVYRGMDEVEGNMQSKPQFLITFFTGNLISFRH